MVAESVFVDLRRLADWFSTSPQRTSVHIERIVARLGVTAVPLLGRELRSADPRRREASRAALASIAQELMGRARVIAELRAITDHDAADDETKVCALGLLAELGERAAARFSDPNAIQQRSAIALAAQLSTDADVASAADLMVRQLDEDDIVQMLEVMAEAAPAAAHRLAAELAVRLDLAIEARERIAAAVADHEPPAPGPPPERRRPPRASQIAVLVDASARIVVVASRKVIGERRWRRWAVLIDAGGRIDDCLHEDDGGPDADAAPLIAGLTADGYRVASADLDHARTVVAAAARLTVASPRADADGTPASLGSAYYLGRDLLGLGDAHLGARPPQSSAMLARALEHLADGEVARAEALLQRCDQASPEAAAALAAIHLGRGEAGAAVAALERALAAEPAWPLHHWNLAVALHQLGDHGGCFFALRRFVSTSALPTGLYADPAQPGRVVVAERMIAELERAARITGTPLRRRRRRAATGATSTSKASSKASTKSSSRARR